MSGPLKATDAPLSAQPSPGGQVDATIKDAYIRHFGWECGWLGDVGFGFIEGYRAALAARQPVGEPAAWVHEEDPSRVISASQKATALRDQGASGSSVRPYSVPAYLHAPAAQAVDLVQEHVATLTVDDDGMLGWSLTHIGRDLPEGEYRLALIDSQA